MQIRQSNINNRVSAQSHVFQTFQELMSCFRNNPDLCNVIRKGFWEWDSLTKNEQAVLHSYWGDLVNHCLMSLNLHESGALSLRDYQGLEDNVLSAITTDGLAPWWRDTCKLYPAHFIERIDARLADPSTLPPKFPERYSFWELDEA
jgi:hypothetical protein